MNSVHQPEIPDSIRPYLEEIAERLWTGRAAVMIGAGFSKNAGSGFPDWNQLGDLFYLKAHGVKPDVTQKKYLNVLRLAEEVQASIGRPALENLIRSSIPDKDIEPSDLHIELLELPWVDLFTTNYDTLLERASTKIATRRYEPVVNKADLPYAIKPRIVKLHGSLPSERPFIITEEDYRRYPNDYAPFVNTVRQSLLENTFCLIGFSGDDPNFLEWIGWIRDNFGNDKTQKIFLVGVFDLSTARLQLLAQRGIIVIDLSCYKEVGKSDHTKALRKFFKYIRSKKPEVLDWPYNPQYFSPLDNTARIDEIRKITEVWRQQRKAFPGWLILPHSNRKALWRYTESWTGFLPEIEETYQGLDIQYVFELIWRLERCLLPIFDNVALMCEKLLEHYWPFCIEDPPTNYRISRTDDKQQDLPWDEIQQAWIAITLAMMRYYREEGQLDKWQESENLIKTLIEYLTVDQKELLNYEGFLLSIFSLDIPNAKHRLLKWQPNEAQPYWMIKRAAAFAEIGILNEAITVSREALEKIRRKLNQNINSFDLTLFSQESSAMLLGDYIQNATGFMNNNIIEYQEQRAQFFDRWNELKSFKCDPWNEMLIFDLTMKNPAIISKNISERREFDIGRITQTRHFSGGVDQDTIDAYAYLKFHEEVGIPFSIRNFTMGTKTATASIKRIARHSPFLATATLIRVGDTKAVDNLFDRESVSKINVHRADLHITNYLKALNESKEDIHEGDALRDDNYGVRLANMLPEVISRLCCKCSSETKYNVLNFIIGLYASPDRRNYRNVGKLTERLLGSMSEEEKYNIIPDLLNIPFPENLNHLQQNTGDFVNPFLILKLESKPESSKVLDIQSKTFNRLFNQAEQNDVNQRKWAITSLVILFNYHLLNKEETKKLSVILWSKVDRFGLPADTDFYKFKLINLPHEENIDPSQLFREFIKKTPFPIQKHEKSNSVKTTAGHIPLVNEIIGAFEMDNNFWTSEEVEELLERLIEWWNADKEWLNRPHSETAFFSSIPDEFRARFLRLVELLAKVVGPTLKVNLKNHIKTSLNHLFIDFREHELPVLHAESACLHIFPDHYSDLLRRIDEALISDKEESVIDGLNSLYTIIRYGKKVDENDQDLDPTIMLSQYIKWCPLNHLTNVLWIIIQLLQDSPDILAGEFETSALIQLNRLLNKTNYEDSDQDLIFDEKLELRRIAAILASSMWKCYKQLGYSVPDVIKRWRDVCSLPDEFAEIRNAWRN